MDRLEVEHPLDPQLTIAAALHLLSSASLRGTTLGKCEALSQHLRRLSENDNLSSTLRQCCAELHETWAKVVVALSHECECHGKDGHLVH